MPDTLKDRWRKKEDRLGLPEFLRSELVSYGNTFLPKSAAPFVSFAESEKSVDQAKYFSGQIDDEVFTLIGSDGAGNPICEEVESGKIYLLDHEKRFEICCFVNSSVTQLAESLLAFLGEQDSEVAGRSISAIDPDAIREGSFWHCALLDLEGDV